MAIKTPKTKKAPRKSKQTTATTIPTAIRPKGTGMPKGGAASMLGALAGIGKKSVPKAEKKDRPKLVLSEELQEQFARVAPAKMLKEYLDAYFKTERGALMDGLSDEFTAIMWKAKSQPNNPSFAVDRNGKPDCSAMYVVMAKFSVQVPDLQEEESIEEAMSRILVELCGLNPTKAAKLVETELDFTPDYNIFLTNLMLGAKGVVDAISKSAAEKLIGAIMGGAELDLDDEERASLIEIKHRAVVTKGFLERVYIYCDTLEQLRAVLMIIAPQYQFRSVMFGISDTRHIRSNRLAEACKKIIGEAKDEE